ncbi:MAG: hypothetical protein LUD47_07125 [Clostridia bacterium]|nr:hypothetical protein [Clostridia bacterium]
MSPKRVYSRDPEKLLEEGRQIVSSNEYGRYIYRVVLVNFVLAGNTVSCVPEMSGVAVTTLNGWVGKIGERERL